MMVIYLLILTLITPHSLISNVECGTTEQGASCLPADEARAEEAVSQVTQATSSQDPTAETQSNNLKVEPTPVSQEGPENMEVEKEEEKQETTPSGEQEELLNSGSDGMPIAEPFCKDPPKLPASPASVDRTDRLSMANQQERSPCQDPQSPPPLSLSVDTQEALSAVDMEERLLPHSEEEEEEEDEDDDEPMKGEGHIVDIKQEMQEREVKPELMLDLTFQSSGQHLGSNSTSEATVLDQGTLY